MPETMPPVDRASAALWAPWAWVGEPGSSRWQRDVLMRVGDEGRWTEVRPGVPTPPAGTTVLRTPALPGLVDAHSHAFQRAFAGMSERREQAHDDFWSWRDRMYAVALRVTPQQLRAIAAQLYVELLQGGYTQVCEFHYLQHDRDGRRYDDPLTLSWALADAADDAGIGLTVLPVVYERAGFAQPALRADQRRFALDADGAWSACQRLRAARRPQLSAGVALHSLRAATPASIRRLRALTDGFDGPVHVHVAEQTAEVDDCLAATGKRPLQWLADEGLLDARWQLVHATHATRAEVDAVAASGAGVVLCPSTEANLGDGLADLPGWLDAGVPLAVGSDSQATRDWREELRWLDYGQRLQRRQRNVAAGAGESASAARLWRLALAAGARAGTPEVDGLRAGARADLLVADEDDAALLGVPPSHVLDAMVFSAPARPWYHVMVAGRWVIRDGVHPRARPIAERFAQAMQVLWSDAGGGT